MATGRLGGPGTLVAFSSGPLLNIAQGRFGPHPVGTVRFIATLGTDYGVIAVHRDARYQNLASAPGYAQLCSRYGLYPFALTGAALDDFVQRSAACWTTGAWRKTWGCASGRSSSLTSKLHRAPICVNYCALTK